MENAPLKEIISDMFYTYSILRKWNVTFRTLCFQNTFYAT